MIDPHATNSRRIRALIVFPHLKGGINSMFQQLISVDDNPEYSTHYFYSHDEGVTSILLFPFRIIHLLYILIYHKYDICHINLSIKGSTIRKFLLAQACRLSKTPYVIHLHGGHYPEFFAKLPPFARTLTRSLYLRAARVIVLGRFWRDFVISEIGVPAERVVILANAVKGPDTAIHRRPNTPARLLLLGRVGKNKGVPELLEALATPNLQALNWSAVIAGDGEVETYRNRARELGLEGRVALPGWVGGDEVAALLTKSNILLLPSHVENLPLSMLEGMGYGLVPVVTPVGAIPDVIRDGENGLIVPAGDAQALAEAIARLIEHPDLRQELASQARADFEAQYDIRHYRKKLETVYLDTLGSRS